MLKELNGRRILAQGGDCMGACSATSQGVIAKGATADCNAPQLPHRSSSSVMLMKGIDVIECW